MVRRRGAGAGTAARNNFLQSSFLASEMPRRFDSAAHLAHSRRSAARQSAGKPLNNPLGPRLKIMSSSANCAGCGKVSNDGKRVRRLSAKAQLLVQHPSHLGIRHVKLRELAICLRQFSLSLLTDFCPIG